MNEQDSDNRTGTDRNITRRKFVSTTAAGSAALLTGGLSSLLRTSAEANPAQFIEATIPELQGLMTFGVLTSLELTRGYLRRIERLNPLLHAVIETNPDAERAAERLDQERSNGHVRGPLHGIPIIVKDNIATDDNMQTTAGSLALLGSRVPADALIVHRLRDAGAVILGKANLSEWANFRGNAPFNGWSARGGFTRDPYLLSFDPCGSSSGSAVAAATNLCAAAIGTETDGSIVCPAGNNLIFGLKPTLGLVSQDGIIPIAHAQDTAGPMARSVTDIAILLNVLRSPFGPVQGFTPPHDYTKFLDQHALRGARIGVDRRYFHPRFGGEADINAVVQRGLDAMTELGATLVDTDTGNSFHYFNAEFTVLLIAFKAEIAQYLAGLKHTSQRTLADLIQFNIDHCQQEMKFFGQEVFQLSEATSGNVNGEQFLRTRARSFRLAGPEGINAALQRDNLDAIVAPSFSFASSPAAVAGYPNISIPIALTPAGKPAGIWMYSGFLEEPKLLGFAFSLEQKIHPRTTPQFLGTVPPQPPNAGICDSTAPAEVLPNSASPQMPFHLGTGKPFLP